MLPPIKGLIENTLIDWEGKIASILFLPGCNLRCPYCHAGHLVGAPEALEAIPFEAIERLGVEHRGWIDGMVISGGEPTLHAGLPELCERIRALGLLVKLDTNGTHPEVVEGLLERDLLDYVAMDVKAPFDERYEPVTGVSCDVDTLRRSAMLIMDSGVEHEFRMTVCPRFTAAEEVVEAARGIRGAAQFILQRFNPEDCLDPSLRNVKPYTPEDLKEFAAKAREFVSRCFLRGDAVAEAAD